MNEGVLGRYWRSYGGTKALLTSPYLYIALLLSALMTPLWLYTSWNEIVLSIMPNVLGFSLGGYALLVAIGDENFRALISGENEKGEPSPYMSVNASFVHFILMQLFSIISALLSASYNALPENSEYLLALKNNQCIPFEEIILFGSYLGFSIFIYALLTAIAATLSILRVSSWYDLMHTKTK